MASYYQAAERALPRNCSADWVAFIKYVDGVLIGNDTTQQIALKRALYVASLSGPGGNTTQVQPISDSDIMTIPPNDIGRFLLDPLVTFQVSGVLPPIQIEPQPTPVVWVTGHPAVLQLRGNPQFYEQPRTARPFCYSRRQRYIQRVHNCHRRTR